MSAKHAVLALVIERPGYGYQLAQRVQERCGSWRWGPSTVYAGLDTLARADLVSVSGAKSGSGTARAAPRAIYAPTAKGTAFFDDWMLGCEPLGPVREELELKILLARPQDYGSLIDMAWAEEQACAERLRELGANAARDWREVLVGDAEIKHWRTRMEWLQGVNKTVKTARQRAGPKATSLGRSGRSGQR